MDLGQFLLLVLLGLLAAGYGTLIGASGSFILVPSLLFLYPGEPPTHIAPVTLAVSFFSALSGSVSYGRQGRIDYRGGLILIVGMVAGGVLGAFSTAFLDRRTFELVVGTFLIGVSLYQIGVSAYLRIHNHHNHDHEVTTSETDDPPGVLHTHVFHPVVGIGSSSAVGFVAGLVGIGGGPLLVPILVRLLHFPVHEATGTALFVILPQVMAGTLEHAWAGHFARELWLRVLPLALGVIGGAQLGTRFSRRVHSNVILRILYLSLGAMGIALIARALVV